MPSSLRTMNTPKLSLKRWSTVPTWKSEGKPALNCCGGSNSTLGNMNRVVAMAPAPQAAAKAVQATPSVDRNPRRVISPAGLAVGGPVAAAAGFGVAGTAGLAAAGETARGARAPAAPPARAARGRGPGPAAGPFRAGGAGRSRGGRPLG